MKTEEVLVTDKESGKVMKFLFPEGADAIYIIDEYQALPMKRSKKNPKYFYYHEKYFEVGTVSRETARKYGGMLILRDGTIKKAEPVKIVEYSPFSAIGGYIVYIVKVTE